MSVCCAALENALADALALSSKDLKGASISSSSLILSIKVVIALFCGLNPSFNKFCKLDLYKSSLAASASKAEPNTSLLFAMISNCSPIETKGEIALSLVCAKPKTACWVRVKNSACPLSIRLFLSASPSCVVGVTEF